MKLAKVITVFVLSGASLAYAAAQVVTFKGAAEFTAKVTGEKGEGLEIKKTETRFFDQHVFSGKTESGYERVYKVVQQSSTDTLVDGETDLSFIEAYQTTKNLLDTKVWALKSRGGDFQIYNDDFVQVSEEGCCDSPTLNHLINSENGKQVVAAINGSTLQFEVPNSKLAFRYLAIVQDEKAPPKRGDRNYIGSIGYFTNNQMKGLARIFAFQEKGAGSDLYSADLIKNEKDEKQGSRVTLWSANKSNDAKAAFNGIGLSGTIYVGKDPDPAFSIVVDHDELSQQLSKVAPALELEVVKLN